MFDAFPYDEWSEQITTFWTFGVEGDTGTIILTILGVLLMIGALIVVAILLTDLDGPFIGPWG